MNFIYTLCYHLIKLIPFRSLRRRARCAVLWHKEHPQVSHYLNKNYVTPFLNGKFQHHKFKPLKKFKDEKIIWQLWFQGYDNAPKLVKRCFDSVQKQMGGGG